MNFKIIDDDEWDASDQLPIETQERIARGRDLIERYRKENHEVVIEAMGTAVTLPVPEELRGKRVKIKMEVL